MCVLQETAHKINTVGINHHELTGLPIVTASVVLQTNWGPIVCIFHEYAHLGKGSSIHASSHDRIPSTTPGAEPPRDAKDSGSARSHSTHLETSSSYRP